ncbi:hypothetical protein TNCV_331281 [Trichonephila clavipes]|nr:hypothetical protein TNCV_331281 [Trichonephila clavipes]
MPLDNCRIGPLAGAPPTRVGHQHWTESGFDHKDDTLQSVTLLGRKIQSTQPMMWGQVVSVSDFKPTSVNVSLWFLLMALDVWKEATILDSIPTTVNAARRDYPRYQISSEKYFAKKLLTTESSETCQTGSSNYTPDFAI